MQLRMNDTVVDENGKQLTKPQASKLGRDHIIKLVMASYTDGKESAAVHFNVSVEDGDEVTLRNLLDRATVRC